VSTRSREIATLRAIGFGAGPVVASVLVEALLLTLIGACLGAAIAALAFDGRQMVSDYYMYTMTIRPTLLAIGIGGAVAIGLLGGLPPAIRAARLPVAQALRAS
jgi:putative ABC transport system permease protein